MARTNTLARTQHTHGKLSPKPPSSPPRPLASTTNSTADAALHPLTFIDCFNNVVFYSDTLVFLSRCLRPADVSVVCSPAAAAATAAAAADTIESLLSRMTSLFDRVDRQCDTMAGRGEICAVISPQTQSLSDSRGFPHNTCPRLCQICDAVH